uniref:Uncharacterized protein n=1 Tax=Romanomermis culicivorax TaxID=13658 RepID=A0A915IQP0_ROMCU
MAPTRISFGHTSAVMPTSKFVIAKSTTNKAILVETTVHKYLILTMRTYEETKAERNGVTLFMQQTDVLKDFMDTSGLLLINLRILGRPFMLPSYKYFKPRISSS